MASSRNEQGVVSRRLAVLSRLESVVTALQRVGLGRLVTGMRRVLERLIGDHVEARVEGLRMRAPLAERGYLQLLASRQKDTFLVERFLGSLGPGARVFDGGAHWGYFTLLAAQAVGPAGSVVAFEPDARSSERLEWNVRANGFGDRVTVVKAALSDTAGTHELFAHPRHHSWSSLFATPGSEVAHSVSTVTADDTVEGAFDVVKLDVEGSEVAALRGMRDLLARRDRQPVLFVECHPEALRRAGTGVSDLLAEVRAAGYDIRAIDEQTGNLRDVDGALEGALFVNLVCEPTGRPGDSP
jgi:FkbM family methyltransferase